MILVRLLVNSRLLVVKCLGSQKLYGNFRVLGFGRSDVARSRHLRVSKGYLKTLELKREFPDSIIYRSRG